MFLRNGSSYGGRGMNDDRRATGVPFWQTGCRQMSRPFLHSTCVAANWKSDLYTIIRVYYYFIQGESSKTAWTKMGGEKYCSISLKTIGRRFRQLRKEVAVVGLQEMLACRVVGNCQLDETFTHSRRKHNTGRVGKRRNHTLVNSLIFHK